ncbi:MAG: hypothetical protein K6E30_04065, partial [Lachnospiraceae bacterium]|nr:hypothetical protein [Lachnospiraceae bacterium]
MCRKRFAGWTSGHLKKALVILMACILSFSSTDVFAENKNHQERAVLSTAQAEPIRMGKDGQEAADSEGESAGAVREAEEEAASFFEGVLEEQGPDYSVRVSVGRSAGLPEDVSLRVREINRGTEEYTACLSEIGEDQEAEENRTAEFARFFDIAFLTGEGPGEEIEPLDNVTVEFSFDEAISVAESAGIRVAHFAEEGNVQELEADAVSTGMVEGKGAVDSVSFMTDDFSVYGIYTKNKIYEQSIGYTDPGQMYRITMKYNEEAGIHKQAELTASELSGEEYDRYMDEALDYLGKNLSNVSYGKIFKVSVMKNKNNTEQPKVPVSLSIELMDDVAKGISNARVIYFEESWDDKEEPWEMKAVTSGNTVTFDTFGIYVFAVVDFSVAKDEQITAEVKKGTDAANVNDSLSLKGSMPAAGEVEAKQVEAQIGDKKTLVAYDISVYANSDMKDKGITWQPGDNGVEVTLTSDSLTSEYVDVYHLADGSTEPELVTTAKVKDHSVTFTANAFSVYVITETTISTVVTTSDGSTYEIKVTYQSTSGIPMEGTNLLVTEILPGEPRYETYVDASAEELGAKTKNIAFSRIFDISIVDEKDQSLVYEPTGDVSVSIRLIGSTLTDYPNVDVLHFVEKKSLAKGTRSVSKTADVIEMDSKVSGESVEFTTDSFSVYVVAGYTIEKIIEASDGNTYKITVEYPEDAGIPADAELVVEEVSDTEYETYLMQAASSLGADIHSISYGKLFNISIQKDDTHYQPGENVTVTVELLDAGSVSDVQVVHFEDDGSVSKLASSTEGTAVTFETDGFSIFSILDFSLLDRIVNAVLGEQTGTLYENDDIILTGRMPALGIVEAERVEVSIGGQEPLIAYDIKVYSSIFMKARGITWQPGSETISVTVKSDALNVENADVYHLDTVSAAPELVSEFVPIENHSVTFDADSFSVYAISSSPRKKYLFYKSDMTTPYLFKLDDSQTEQTNMQIIKNGEPLVMPQLPEETGKTFLGWYVFTSDTEPTLTDIGSGVYAYTFSDGTPVATDTQQAFGEAISVTADETVYLYAKFGVTVTVTFHSSKDTQNDVWPIAFSRFAEVENGSATVLISDVTVNPVSELDVFVGWTDTAEHALAENNTNFVLGNGYSGNLSPATAGSSTTITTAN